MNLDLFFSEVVEIEQHEFSYDIEEVYKKDGEIVRTSRTETFILKPYNDLDSDILDKILNLSSTTLKAPKNFFQRLFKKNELKNLIFNEYDIIYANDKILNQLEHINKVNLNINKLIIQSGKDKILINKKNKLFYFDTNRFKVYQII
jgi:hypothetical protein